MSWHIILPDLEGDETTIKGLRDRLCVWLAGEGLDTSTVTIDSALFRLETRNVSLLPRKREPKL